MSALVNGKTTICVVNYKTLDFTRLCLRSIRKFTKSPYEVLVIDNDSADDSLSYLKKLEWIRLIERKDNNDSSGGVAHASALQLGLNNCNTEFFISMHSDAFVHKDNWLADLINYFNSDENVACVGSGKIELTPPWQITLKKITDYKTFKRKLLRTPDPFGHFRYYNRTVCCIYRTDILRRENLTFTMGQEKGITAGKKLYFELVDRSYKTVELPDSLMKQYVIHLAHATQVVNPNEFALGGKTVRKCRRLVKKIMSDEVIKSVIEDESLDQ